jgi:methionine-rich copper-binding protein CopC
MRIDWEQYSKTLILFKFISLLLFCGLALVVVPVVLAHAELREAFPEIGAIYRWQRPSEVRLSFTQKLEESGNSIIVTNRRFEEVQEGVTQLEPEESYTILVALPALPAGTYTVNWETNSVDGHALKGAYDFTLFSREAIVTRIIAAMVFVGMGIFVYSRRAKPEE